MISRVAACFFMDFCSFKCIKRHIQPSNHLFLQRLRSREGAARSVSGATRGGEREGWDVALCKQKNHSTGEGVSDLNHRLVTKREQGKWERMRRGGGSRRGHIRRRKQGGFLCWKCRSGSMSHLLFSWDSAAVSSFLCGMSN